MIDETSQKLRSFWCSLQAISFDIQSERLASLNNEMKERSNNQSRDFIIHCSKTYLATSDEMNKHKYLEKK
jgi:hypothetical protein